MFLQSTLGIVHLIMKIINRNFTLGGVFESIIDFFYVTRQLLKTSYLSINGIFIYTFGQSLALKLICVPWESNPKPWQQASV